MQFSGPPDCHTAEGVAATEPAPPLGMVSVKCRMLKPDTAWKPRALDNYVRMSSFETALLYPPTPLSCGGVNVG